MINAVGFLVPFLSTPPSRVATCPYEDGCGWFDVSIHATLAGGDHAQDVYEGTPLEFLSTPPSRVATGRLSSVLRRRICFYPRHPRGWRHCAFLVFVVFFTVSIHATLAGGDRPFCGFSARFFRFYPRHPRGWRPAESDMQNPLFDVSIHATLAGGDPHRQGYPKPGREVSIHATLAGGDPAIRPAGGVRLESFYPRHPRGWRRGRSSRGSKIWVCFYPRHPRGWRPKR